MLNNLLKCPVCHTSEFLIPGDDEGHIMCEKDEKFYEPHFSWQVGDEAFEAFVFGHYQIFFFSDSIEIYDLTPTTKRLNKVSVVYRGESSVRFEDINSDEKLENFIQNMKIIS